MANLSNINGKFVVEQTTGYVGVGTTDPEYLLHVNSSDIPNGTRLTIENTNGSGKKYGLISDNTGVFTVRDLTAGSDRFSISNLGNATFAKNVLLNGYLSVEGTTGNTGGATDRWIGGDGTTGTWFYNVPTGSSHLFGINNSNVLTLNGTGAAFTGNVFARRGSFGTASNFNFDLYCNGNAYINDELTVQETQPLQKVLLLEHR
jgi:hypothetical protein